MRCAIAAVPLFLVLRLDLSQHVDWFHHRTHRLYACTTDLDRSLPEGSVVGGSWAPALLLGSRKRAVCLTDWANLDDPLGRFGLTHIVTVEGEADEELLRRLYPGLMETARPFKRYRVADVEVTVRIVPRPGTPVREGSR